MRDEAWVKGKRTALTQGSASAAGACPKAKAKGNAGKGKTAKSAIFVSVPSSLRTNGSILGVEEKAASFPSR